MTDDGKLVERLRSASDALADENYPVSAQAVAQAAALIEAQTERIEKLEAALEEANRHLINSAALKEGASHDE